MITLLLSAGNGFFLGCFLIEHRNTRKLKALLDDAKTLIAEEYLNHCTGANE